MIPIVELWIDEKNINEATTQRVDYPSFSKRFKFVCPSCKIKAPALTDGKSFILIAANSLDDTLNACCNCGIRIKLRVRKADEIKQISISEDCLLENDWYSFRCPYCNNLASQFMRNSAYGIEAKGAGARKQCFKCRKYFLVRVRKADPADHLLEVLSPHEIIYIDADHVASEFERLRKLVRNYDERLLAAVMSFWKWKQNRYSVDGSWSLGFMSDSCPSCLLHNPDGENGCGDCSPSLKKCAGSRDGGSPYVETVNRSDKKPLLAALKLALAYEIENHDDYNPEALRAALAGEDTITYSGHSVRQEISIEEEIPEVIAEEGEDGEYLYKCPYCGKRRKVFHDGVGYSCADTGESDRIYTVRRRTRYERWAEEETELWCVWRNNTSDVWDIIEAKGETTGKGLWIIGSSVQKIVTPTQPKPHDYFVAYLGESRTKAFEIACEKWEENNTPLYYVSRSCATYGDQKTYEIKNNVKVIKNKNGELKVYYDMRFHEDYKIAASFITTDLNKAIAWLKEKLVNDEC